MLRPLATAVLCAVKNKKIFSGGKPNCRTGPVQRPVQIVARYRDHDLSLIVDAVDTPISSLNSDEEIAQV